MRQERVAEACRHEVAAVRIGGPFKHRANRILDEGLAPHRSSARAGAAVRRDLALGQERGEGELKVTVDTSCMRSRPGDAWLLGESQVMGERRGVASHGLGADLTGVGAAAEVADKHLDELAMTQPTATQAGIAAAVEALLDLAGTGDGRDQVAVDAVGQVRLGRRVPRLLGCSGRFGNTAERAREV